MPMQRLPLFQNQLNRISQWVFPLLSSTNLQSNLCIVKEFPSYPVGCLQLNPYWSLWHLNFSHAIGK